MAQVHVYGTLRIVTGQKTIALDLPAQATLGDYLAAIVGAFPALGENLLDERGSLRRDAAVFINGRNPRLQPDYLNRVLQPEDVISLFSPVSSGRINVEILRRPTLES